MCQVQSGGDTNHTAHCSWSLIETSCKSTIKQEVSTLPGTSINRSMTFQMRTWGCKRQRSNKLWDTPAHHSIWYVSTCLPMSQHVLTHEVLILNPSFEIDVICKYEKQIRCKIHCFRFIYFAMWYAASMQKIKTRKRRSMSKSLRHFSGTREAPRGEMHDCTTNTINTMNRDRDTTSGCNWHKLARTRTALQIFETTSYIMYSQWACESVC